MQNTYSYTYNKVFNTWVRKLFLIISKQIIGLKNYCEWSLVFHKDVDSWCDKFDSNGKITLTSRKYRYLYDFIVKRSFYKQTAFT